MHVENRGLARGCIITGSSVHNCRMERIHRDVYAGVLTFYAKLFNDWEEMGILNPVDEISLYTLHHITHSVSLWQLPPGSLNIYSTKHCEKALIITGKICAQFVQDLHENTKLFYSLQYSPCSKNNLRCIMLQYFHGLCNRMKYACALHCSRYILLFI